MHITINDINFNIHGFMCPKIKKIAEEKLIIIDRTLSKKITSVDYVNMDDMGFLTVGWENIQNIDEDKKQKIVKIINEVLI